MNSTTNEKKYYWASFKIEKARWIPNMPSSFSTFNVQELTDKFPIELQNERNEKYGKEFLDEPPPKAKSRERYELLNWKEITKDEYKKFKGTL